MTKEPAKTVANATEHLPLNRRRHACRYNFAADLPLLPPSLTLRRVEKASAWQAQPPLQLFNSCIVSGL